MPVVTDELKLMRPAVINDTGANGGRMSSTEIVSGVKNNILPDLSHSERVAGLTRWRKVFMKVANDDDIAFQGCNLFVETPTPGDDRVEIAAGTLEDTQSDLSSPRLYGSGALDADASATDTTIDVLVEDPGAGIFVAGDTIRISDKDDVGASGNEEEAVIDAGGVSYDGNVATLTLTAGLTNSYTTAANTRVASLLETGTVDSEVISVVETTAAGTLAEEEIQVDHIGGITQDWTLTFSDATNFTVVGDGVGSVGSGTIGSDFAPSNGAFSKPFFTIPSSAWGGTWTGGDTVTFTTNPAAVALWLKHTVPPGASSISGNGIIIGTNGESA